MSHPSTPQDKNSRNGPSTSTAVAQGSPTASDECQATSSAPVHTEPVTLGRVMRSEWIKFRSLRSSWAVLGAAVLMMVAFGAIIGFNTRHLSASQDPDNLGKSATLQGYYLGQLLIGALGVLFVSGEFSTGMVRSTFAAVPRRLPVLIAKLAVFLAISTVAMISASIIAFLVGQAIISQDRSSFSLADSGVLRIVLGAGIYLALAGLLGGAIGWIVRSTPGSLVAYFGLMLVVPVVLTVAFGHWGMEIYKYMPSGAGSSFFSSPQEPDSLHPWAGLGVLIAWIIAALAAAAFSLRHRDA